MYIDQANLQPSPPQYRKMINFAKSSPQYQKMVNFAKSYPPLLNIDLHPWRKQNATYLVKDKLGPKKICVTNCSKRAKMPIAVCKFSKIFRESMPADPLESFLFPNLLQI